MNTMRMLDSNSAMKPYYFNCILPTGHEGYMYVLSPTHMEEILLEYIEDRQIPSFAVVVAAGRGQPDEVTLLDMKRHYGFDATALRSSTLCDLQKI